MPTELLVINIVIFSVSMYVLIKTADWFTEFAERAGKILCMPAFLVGVVIVAVGTSLPELFTSIMAVISNESEIVISDIFGSAITNILLGLGFASFAAKQLVTADKKVFFKDFPIFVAALLIMGAMASDGKINIFESLILVFGLVTYFAYSAIAHKRAPVNGRKIPAKACGNRKDLPKIFFIILLNLIGIIASSKLLVNSVISIADLLGLGTAVLAASAVAIGTSLPEIMVTVVTARKGKFELLAGNILGSNVFNIFAGGGIAGLFGTLYIGQEIFALFMAFLLGTVALYWIVLDDGEVTKPEGMLLVVFYGIFLGKLFNVF